MKALRVTLVLSWLVISGNTCLSQGQPAYTDYPEFNSLLDSFNLEGSILIYDFENKVFYSNNFQWANEGHLPASTFKIPNSIIALETGVIGNDSSILHWNGEKRALKVWEKDLKFYEAFRVSCVPCYQEIASKIGYERMKSWLARLDYPGMTFEESEISKFWLEGDSRISQMQQVDFLRRFYFSELPVTSRTEYIVKSIMRVEKSGKYTLSGKTGWGIREGNNNAWYVGYLETGDNVWFFATNVVPGKGFNMDNFTSARIEITIAVLKKMGLM